MEKRTDMRAEALDTLIDIERNKKLSHIAIGETLMRHQFEKKSDEISLNAFKLSSDSEYAKITLYSGSGLNASASFNMASMAFLMPLVF